MSHSCTRFGVLAISLALLLPAARWVCPDLRAAPPTPDLLRTLDAPALSRLIDQEIQRRLERAKVQASCPADDAEFLRRVYLDLHGVIPPPEKVVAFLDSKEGNRRARLIDELLASPRYGQNMADIWGTLLLGDTQNVTNKGVPKAVMTNWLEAPFNKNQPWNRTVFELLTATGTVNENGAVRFYLNGQNLSSEPQRSITDLTDSVSSLFLGVQLKCTQCHNHFLTDSWKKADYWGVAGFFTNLTLGSSKQGFIDGDKVSAKKDFIDDDARGRLTAPKFLLGERPPSSNGVPARRVFAEWATSPTNPFLARAMVNRTWAHFFGRGFVNPIDDLRPDNPPSHPELLDRLSEQFVANGFDLKYLIRAICNSQAYQRTSRPEGGNDADGELFSHMPVRVMSGAQLYDSLAAVMNKPPDRGKGNSRLNFVEYFSADDEPTSYQRGVPHLLRLMNSNEFSSKSAPTFKGSPEENIERLYLLTLSRRPTAQERERMMAFVKQPGKDPRRVYEQILWVLLNTSEFSLNH